MNASSQPLDRDDFPVKQIFTNLEWDDLILDPAVNEKVIQTRIDIKSRLIDRATLYGPLGTGKTTTAALLGKIFLQNVYRIDAPKLTQYKVGEMKIYLDQFFTQAQENVWILVLHEPYSLFRNSDAEISEFLIEKVKNYKGIMLFIINGESQEENTFYNKDYKTIVFTKPNVQERIMLWKEYLAFDEALLDPEFLKEISERFAVTGGQIVNAVRRANLAALKRSNPSVIQRKDLIEAIINELKK
ncbi:AAA family ATPase [Chryseobacterium sediminis]|uniref:AAA family ATPase n=1 Tax=Chryseobacterium sediminis TaxID=1679494 RepID=A0A5B2U4G8_9FLAO|nr:AAA family ATPase [Chryseobacterium sediminis]KAA2221402.1 AAA family ATPase [Chryseobacterium sediminis]